MDLNGALAVLRQTPPAVAALLAGLPEDLLAANEGPETFSARDVVGHLVHGEETDWVPRIRIILEHGPARPFTPFDRTGFRAGPSGGLFDGFEEESTTRRTRRRGAGKRSLEGPERDRRSDHS